MAVQFTRAGNFRARVLNVNPTGEKHKTTWRAERVTKGEGEMTINTNRYIMVSTWFAL